MASKKMTIGEIEQIKAKATQERAQAAIDLTELVKRAALLEQEAQAAADGGDLEAYREKKAQAEAVNEEIFVKQAKAAKQENPITEDMAAAAWETYRADHDKKFKAKLSAYQAAKAELLTMYRDLLSMQREAFKTRERLAGYLGMDTNRGFMQAGTPDNVGEKFPCEVLPADDVVGLHFTGTAVRDPDSVFYLACRGITGAKLLSDPETVQLYNLLIAHRSK